jgi:hypothetical protein
MDAGNCDGDDMCCPSPGPGVCTPHNTEHCEDCDTGCTIATGGPWCNPDGYLCQCTDDTQCTRFPFSAAYCDLGMSDECLCTAADICPMGQACCFRAGSNECVELANDANHCSICRAACAVGEACSSGACSCVDTIDCPDTGGQAQQCVSTVCVCPWYGNSPCPVGQYCCSPGGCCMDICGSGGNECSAQCELDGYIWCDWGCCDTCQTENDC